MLETYLCDTLAACKPISMGGIVPEGTGRIPHIETRPCEPGKYMYYGWEDMPGFDRDFNDLRIILECPRPGVKKALRLVS